MTKYGLNDNAHEQHWLTLAGSRTRVSPDTVQSHVQLQPAVPLKQLYLTQMRKHWLLAVLHLAWLLDQTLRAKHLQLTLRVLQLAAAKVLL